MVVGRKVGKNKTRKEGFLGFWFLAAMLAGTIRRSSLLATSLVTVVTTDVVRCG